MYAARVAAGVAAVGSAGVRSAVGLRAMSTVEVTNVARVVRMHVSGEDDAVKADAIVRRAAGDLQGAGLSGFQKVTRTVCKAEWAYEVSVVFGSAADFGAFMEGDSIFAPAVEELSGLATEDVYQGNRVYDEL